MGLPRRLKIRRRQSILAGGCQFHRKRSGGTDVRPTPRLRFGTAAVRSRSASPRPRRSLSPLGVSVAQRRTQLAAQSAATAVSGVGRVAQRDKSLRMRISVEATYSRSQVRTRSDVERRVARFGGGTSGEENAARVAERM